MINIPQTLQDRQQWVLWRLVERDGRATKVPFSPEGKPASVSDPNTWTDFETALNAYHRGGFDGIGFVLTQDAGIVCVDIDHARNCTDWTPEAMEMVRLMNSYTEVSPSGQGLHIWCYGHLPAGRRRKNGVEMYDSGRFITVTGDHLPITPTDLQERTAELMELHRQVFGDISVPAKCRELSVCNTDSLLELDDQELLEKAMNAENGAKFRALWRGDTTGYHSQSEADLALCRLLAFWTGGDAERIERLFSQSALGQREKWQTRADYRQRTIAEAIGSLRETYNGNGNGNGHRQNPRQLRQNRATDAEPSGVDNLSATPESRAKNEPGATITPPRKPTRPAPQPWQTQRPKQTADTGGTESADTGGMGGNGWEGSSIITVYADLEDPIPGPGARNPEYIPESGISPNKKRGFGDNGRGIGDKARGFGDKQRGIGDNPSVDLVTAVLGLVRDCGTVTVRLVCDRCGVSVAAAKQVLHRLSVRGALVRVGRGLYGLPGGMSSADMVSVSDIAEQNGISEKAASERMARAVRAGRAQRVGHGLYELLPDDWRRVRVRVVSAIFMTNMHDKRRLSNCLHVQFKSLDGKLRTRFIANDGSGKLRALLEATGISDPLDLEGAELDISVRLQRERTRSGWASFYVVVGVWHGDRLVWRERERDDGSQASQ